jgi:hypothetical protein
MGAVGCSRCVTPLKAVADDMDDAADYAAIIRVWQTMRSGEVRRQVPGLAKSEQKGSLGGWAYRNLRQ